MTILCSINFSLSTRINFSVFPGGTAEIKTMQGKNYLEELWWYFRLDAALFLLSLTISHFLELETIYNLNMNLHQIFKVILAHVKPLCICATLPLYKYIEKTKWKLCYIYVFQFSRVFHNKLINFLNPKIILSIYFILKKINKCFVASVKSQKILEKNSEINLKFPGSKFVSLPAPLLSAIFSSPFSYS